MLNSLAQSSGGSALAVFMPTDLDGALERKRKAAQAEARTNITFLAFVIFTLALLVLLIFY